jgi:D-alanyl-D-alanine carboxypeptidase
MNVTARSLGMTHTRYTDPSGYDDATVSTAADQVRIVERAMRLPVFASIVATPSATLPVAGAVRNTNRLLGQNGFVGVKTGWTAAAGGCFAFRAIRWIDGKRTTITGVVLGQPGDDQVEAGLAAAGAMVDRIAGRRATPDLGQPTLPPPIAPGSHRPRPHAWRPEADSHESPSSVSTAAHELNAFHKRPASNDLRRGAFSEARIGYDGGRSRER